MAGRILLAAVFSAIAMFFWGFVYWSLSGATQQVLSPLPETARDDITAVLRRDKLPSGMYVYPMAANPQNADEAAAAEELFRAGPRFLLAHRLEGSELMPPSLLLAGFGHMFVIALGAAILAAWVLPVLGTFGKRFGFVAFLAVMGSLWTNPGDMIWWLHSPAFCLGKIFYDLVSGLLMAGVIAGIVKRPGE